MAKDEGTGPETGIAVETRNNVQKITDIEKAHRGRRSFGERFAERVARYCGTTTFVAVNAAWFGGWILFNLLTPEDIAFDPFPFTFLTLMVSLEAIFLSIFILTSQNQETRLAEHRDHLDLQFNMLSEQENTTMIKLLEAIAKEIGVPVDEKSVAKLIEPAEPEKLDEQLRSARENDSDKKKSRK